MGSQLSRVSRSRLPNPDPDLEVKLTKMGVQFKDLDAYKIMRDVVLPDGWGLFEVNNNGDIQNSILINSEGQQICLIYWTSDGWITEKGCDNRARMVDIISFKKFINLNKVNLVNGWFVGKPEVFNDGVKICVNQKVLEVEKQTGEKKIPVYNEEDDEGPGRTLFFVNKYGDMVSADFKKKWINNDLGLE